MKIAIGITTTPNRVHVFEYSLKQWQKYLPENAAIYTYCDEKYEGVSVAKNRVLSMCDGADYLFIVDDDCYPISKDWHLPYINSGLNHACWNFNRNEIRYGIKAESKYPYKDITLIEFVELDKPNGCMLFFKRKAIEHVGGWDIDFKGYGYEHVNLSDRIFNAGLTPARYIDIPNSKSLFELIECESSFSYSDRAQIPANYELYQKKFYSKEFKPFK